MDIDIDSFKLCAAAFLCTVTAVMVRQYKSDFVLPVRTAATVVLTGFGAVLLTPVLRCLHELTESILPAEYTAILLRALCIVLMVRVCGSLCRDCGEATIALCLEFAGKAELLLLSLPLIERILDGARVLLQW